jgi:hypothetical protein
MDLRLRTHDRLGLLARAPAQDVALLRRGDVLEDQDAAAGCAVVRPGEAFRNAAADELLAVAPKEQLPLDVLGAFPFHDERLPSTRLCRRRDPV